jgi:WD40 repeat protein
MVGALPYTLLDTTGGTQRKLPELGLGSWAWALVRGGAAVAHIPSSDYVSVFDLSSGQSETRWVKKGSVRGMATDRTGETLYLSVGASNFERRSVIRVVGTADMKPVAEFGDVSDYLGRLALSADGRRLAAYSGSDYNASLRDPNPAVRAWDVSDGRRPERALTRIEPTNPVNDFALSHDGKLLAVADGRALALHGTSPGDGFRRSGQHRRAVTAVACSPTQPLIVTGDKGGQVFLWDTDLRVLKRYGWGLEEVYAVAFAPDGLRVAAVDASGKVVVWDVDA